MKFFMSGEIDHSVDEIFRVLRNEIEDRLGPLKDRDYGSEIVDIGIVPIIVDLSPQMEAAGFFRERKLFKRKDREADFRLRIDYHSFANADRRVQKLLLVKNIVESIRILSQRAKKDFDGQRLEDDILALLEIDKSEVEAVDMRG